MLAENVEIYGNRDGLELIYCGIHQNEQSAYNSLARWGGFKGYKTSVSKRSVKADGLRVTVYIACAWYRTGAS